MTVAKPMNEIASAVIQKTHITVSFKDGKNFSTDSSQETFKKLSTALKAKRGAVARKLVNAADAITSWAQGALIVDKHDNVLYAGKLVSPGLHKRIISLVREQAPVSYLVNFLDNLHKNTHSENFPDLYEFLESQKLPITEDGCFLAFKKVDGEFKDSHTHTIDNRVGAHVETDHEKCDFNRRNTCAASGFHFAGPNYGFKGEKHILIKVSPQWLTSVPMEYVGQKGRCSQYDVIACLLPEENANAVFSRVTVHTAAVKRSKKVEKQAKGVKPAVPKKAAVKKPKATKAVDTAAKKTLAKPKAKKATKSLAHIEPDPEPVEE